MLSGKDKPLQAYKFAATIVDQNEPVPDCLKWLNDFVGSRSIVHDMNYIEKNKKTLEQIKEDEKSYKTLEDPKY